MDINIDDLPSTSAASCRPPKDQSQYALSSIIQGHKEDAKCVVETHNGTLISGGRDGMLKYWQNQNGSWENAASIVQKDCMAINSIAFGSLRSSGWEYLVFIGRKNGSIQMYDPINPSDPIKVIQGHKSNVCILHFDEDTGFLLSGSWDHNAVVWPIEKLLIEEPIEVGIGVLDGHKCSVWAVATVPSKPTKFLTGSADKTIKLWSNNYQEIGIFLGHQDVVRSIVVLSELYFLSTSNDACIILWDIQNGNRLRNVLPLHDQFIYTMARLNVDLQTSLIITCGEGGCLDIWKLESDATLVHKQFMKIPVQSIWWICPMKNRDFALATSSGMILVFTSDPAREAPDDLKEFFFSSQYDELAVKELETQNAKDSTFDMNRFSIQNENGAGENGFLKRVVGTEFGNPSYQDPFTGTGRYIPGNTSSAPVSIDKKRPRNHLVPLKDFYKFGLDGLSKKVLTRLYELNLNQQKDLKLTQQEFASFEEILTEMNFEINEFQIIGLEKGIRWPAESIVPALDIFRIALLHPKINEIFCSLKPVFGNPPKGRHTIGQLLAFLTNFESTEAVRILACRALTNAANHEFGQSMLLSEIANFCGVVSNQLLSPKPSLQISSASAFANFARILLLKTEEAVTELGPREDALRSIISVLKKEQNFGNYSPISILRLLQTIIMLMWGQSAIIYLAMELELATVLGKIKDAVADEDVKILVRDAFEILHAM